MRRQMSVCVCAPNSYAYNVGDDDEYDNGGSSIGIAWQSEYLD